MIQFSNVSKMYGDSVGVADINITIEDGEFVFLVGPSGAGKSTFIKLLLKEKEADEGEIYFDDYEITSLSNRLVPHYRRKVGIVFQDFRLLSTKTVYENVAFAMEAVHQKRKLIKAQVPHILNLVGISDKAHLYPNQLSGGEAQRVAIARAIVNNPKVLIADEPTGNLDPEKSWEIMNLLDQINKRGTTVVMVTHAKDIVDKMGKRVVQLENGRIVRDDRAGHYVEQASVKEIPEIEAPEEEDADKFATIEFTVLSDLPEAVTEEDAAAAAPEAVEVSEAEAEEPVKAQEDDVSERAAIMQQAAAVLAGEEAAEKVMKYSGDMDEEELAEKLKIREQKYQERLKKFGTERKTSSETRAIRLEDLFENVGAIEDHVSEGGGDIFD